MGELPRSRLGGFRQDDEGYALVLFAITVPVLIGLAALSVDVSRLMMLNTEVQSLADAAALAAAKGLKGTATSMDEAVAAAQVIRNNPKFSTASIGSSDPILTYTFSVDLDGPALTYSPADQQNAHFVRVTTRPRSFVGDLVSVISPSTTFNAVATATAGSSIVACKVPPVLICAAGGNLANLPSTLDVGRLYRLKGGGGAAYAPPASGAFGLMDPPGQNTSGSNSIRNNLAAKDPNFCFLSNASRRNGNAATISDGVNVRFDMYSNAGGSTLQTFPPAPNIIKGMQRKATGQCSYVPNSPPAMGLPRGTEPPDTAMGAGSITWDRAGYWAANHGNRGALPASLANATRYEMYLWELQNEIPNGTTGTSPETGAAQCWTGAQPSNTDTTRRILYAAVVDCSGSQVQMKLSTTYVKFFISEPASDQGDVFAEFVGKETLDNNSGVLHHVVQLYH